MMFDKVKSKRIGRFIIPAALLRKAADHLTHEADAEFFAIFRRVVVVETKYRWERDAVEYLGYCDQFEALPLGVLVPIYDVEISRGETTAGGIPVITFEPKFTRSNEDY